MFNKGQKIVCITKFKGLRKNLEPANVELPILDKTYTVKDQFTNGYVNLEEINNGEYYDGEKFAPLNEWKQADEAVKELIKDLELQMN